MFYLSQDRQGSSTVDEIIQKRTGATRYIFEHSVITSHLAGGAFQSCVRPRTSTTSEVHSYVRERDTFNATQFRNAESRDSDDATVQHTRENRTENRKKTNVAADDYRPNSVRRLRSRDTFKMLPPVIT